MKTGKNKSTGEVYSPNIPRSYAVNEILAAGGAAAFADKLGKKPMLIKSKLSLLPADVFLTDQDVNDALKVLNGSE